MSSVYFIQGATTHLIKIGRARNVARRLRDLQSASPDVLVCLAVRECNRAHDIEGWLHMRFRSAHSHGEWFHPTAELLDFIARLNITRLVRRANGAVHLSTLRSGLKVDNVPVRE